MSLVAPFLDKDFQIVARITASQVDLYTRLALLADGTIIASPSPFIESDTSRESILLDAELQACGHLQLSYREDTLENFAMKKLQEYGDIGEYRGVYSEARMDELLPKLSAQRRSRRTYIGSAMRAAWLTEIEDQDEPLNLGHALSGASPTTVLAFRTIPERVQNKAFVWQEIFRHLDALAPDWRTETSPEIVRALISRSYFRVITSEVDTLVSLRDFPAFPCDQGLTHTRTLPLIPLFRLLSGCGMASWLRECSPSEFLEILNAPYIGDFRLAYRSITQESSESSSDDMFLLLQAQHLRELEYLQARQAARSNHIVEMLAFHLLARRSPSRRTQKTPLATFIEGMKRLQDRMTMSNLLAAKEGVHNYYISQAGAVGPGAIAKNFVQIKEKETP